MQRTLVFHTLVSRAWDFQLSHSDPEQPPLLALVAALLDEGGELGRMMRIIKLPEGSAISENAYRESGITEDMIQDEGVPLEQAINEFKSLMEIADYIAAYSVEHHTAVVRRSAKECEIELPTGVSLFCLMKRSTNICKLPSRTAGIYKMPKLVEAYAHFARKEFDLPYGDTPLQILDAHLRARNLIFRGIKLAEGRELKKAAAPLTKTMRRKPVADAENRW